MDAHKSLITNIFNNSTLVEIPFFQRSYVWKEDLWSRLLEDMEFVSKSKRPHFFGTIILKEGRKPQTGDLFTDCRTVVDGQQRLTTFLIFLKVLCLKSGQTALFNCQFRIMGGEIALKHGKNDIDAFEKVMAMDSAQPIENYPSSSRIIDAYNYFVYAINPSKLDIMIVLMNTQFVRIDLDASEDEQQIFDAINSLGVNLTTSELLKNYFFNRSTYTQYLKIWVPIFEKDDATRAYWDTEIETGRVKRAIIDLFFDAFFQLYIQDKTYNISNEDKLMYARVDQLAQSYQHFVSHYCGGDKNVILNDLKDYATCFMDTFRPEVCNMSVPASFCIERLNVVIFGLKNTTLIPYVLYFTKNVSDPLERNKMYGILESYIMRRMVVHTYNKNYNNLFTSMILNGVLDSVTLQNRLCTSSDSTSYVPDDTELQNGFIHSKLINLHAKGILYLIESYIRPSMQATALLGFNNYSLEHLMPKKWRNNWPSCASASLETERDTKLLTLGNLAIIPQTLNTSIRDATWEIKKSGKGNSPGLAQCAAGLITLQNVLPCTTWTESDIDTRAQWLFGKACVLWKL